MSQQDCPQLFINGFSFRVYSSDAGVVKWRCIEACKAKCIKNKKISYHLFFSALQSKILAAKLNG
ncbi:hypothetical protein BpHYR1_053530 [Brachionus plicatilis]|uniref:FLYWCH-type domain-containing protein n=1 Tax=Brachionus plicatilis TaxID=10195 RepID=A0A3M7PA71_BRAPC|nr:hypothetical protein BpHYR1_053530 [Brachionus plicatilis]